MDILIPGNEYIKQFPRFQLKGRDQELDDLCEIIIQKKANSVLMIGAGGVGCSALSLGLEALKANPDASLDVISQRNFWLDTKTLFASSDMNIINKAFNDAMDRLKRTPESILIINDLKEFIFNAQNIGAHHFMSMIDLAIRKGKTQAIVEARDDDLTFILKTYPSIIETFTVFPVSEPKGEALLAILKQVALSLEEHHGISIDEEAILETIALKKKYQAKDLSLSRAQPEASVTLLDRALADMRLDIHKNLPNDAGWQEKKIKAYDLYKKQIVVDAEINKMEEELKGLRAANVANKNSKDIGSTSIDELEIKIERYTKALTVTRNEFINITKEFNKGQRLTKRLVQIKFSELSGVDVGTMNENESEKLLALEEELKKHIYGQDDAIKTVSDAIQVFHLIRDNPHRPLPFLFMGPSGSGKTETTRVLTRYRYNDIAAMLKLDMGDYMEKHSVAKMIGAPPGYEGFEVGGILTNALRKGSFMVALFDEIEKAHPDVMNVQLQILDDGALNDNIGRTFYWDNKICIYTSNIGQPHYLDENLTLADAHARAIADLEQFMRPELLNRFNGRENIIGYTKLTLPSIIRIAERQLSQLNDAFMQKYGKAVYVSPYNVEDMCKLIYQPKVGARQLPGFIKKHIESALVKYHLANPSHRGILHMEFNRMSPYFTTKFEEMKDAA